MKEFISKAEKDFIKGVVRAILKNDTSKEHWLVECNGVHEYVLVPNNPEFHKSTPFDRNKSEAKALCIFSKPLIEDFHLKAGNDELAKPWAKKAVKHIIAIGKEASYRAYGY